MINFLGEEMRYVAGLTDNPPRLHVPVPTYAPVTMNTTNNIRVESGSQVGTINAGAILYLDNVVTNLNEAGGKHLATALQTFTQMIVDDKQASGESQKQVLDLLRAVTEQLYKKGAERNTSMLKVLLEGISPLLTAGTAIANHWEALKKMFEAVFHL